MTLHLRPLTSADAPLLLEWRNDPVTRAHSHTTTAVSWEEHVVWLARQLEQSGHMYVAVNGDTPIGTIRLSGDTPPAVSWTIAPNHRGQGWGNTMLRALLEHPDTPDRLHAEIKQENIASQRMARHCGFLRHEEHAGYTIWQWTRGQP